MPDGTLPDECSHLFGSWLEGKPLWPLDVRAHEDDAMDAFAGVPLPSLVHLHDPAVLPVHRPHLAILAFDNEQTGGTKALTATTEDDFRQGVKEFGACRNDFTDPAERGWPWPWDTSATTDYAYAYDDGGVYGSGFGRPWFEINLDQVNGGEPLDEDEDGNEVEVLTTPVPVFPNMRERQEVRWDEGSGLLIL